MFCIFKNIGLTTLSQSTIITKSIIELGDWKQEKNVWTSQNIFCCVNENLKTFLYTLTGGQENRRRKKFSFLKCIQKSNVIKKIGF